MRNDELGKEARKKDPEYTCNGCDGKGESLKFSSQWVDKGGNTAPVTQVLEKGFKPFAIVTPEGEWLEKGKMGWWACVSDEKDKSVWEEQVKTVLEKYKKYTAVLVDCHI